MSPVLPALAVMCRRMRQRPVSRANPRQLGGAAFGPAHGVANSAIPLPFAAAAGLLVGVAILISLVAARTTVQRDIS
jgi:hypothetical protein